MLGLDRVVRAFSLDNETGEGFIGLPDGTDYGFSVKPQIATGELEAGHFFTTVTSDGMTLRLGLGRGMEIVFSDVTVL